MQLKAYAWKIPPELNKVLVSRADFVKMQAALKLVEEASTQSAPKDQGPASQPASRLRADAARSNHDLVYGEKPHEPGIEHWAQRRHPHHQVGMLKARMSTIS